MSHEIENIQTQATRPNIVKIKDIGTHMHNMETRSRQSVLENHNVITARPAIVENRES